MFAKLNHVAIVSENYAQLSKFYEAMFGMTTSTKTRPTRAVTVRNSGRRAARMTKSPGSELQPFL